MLKTPSQNGKWLKNYSFVYLNISATYKMYILAPPRAKWFPPNDPESSHQYGYCEL